MVLSVYVTCFICSLKGKLDFVYDEETGQPTNVLHIKNPLKSLAQLGKKVTPPVQQAAMMMKTRRDYDNKSLTEDEMVTTNE